MRESLQIREDDLQSAAIAQLLAEHLEQMHEITPPESVHALDLEGLKAPDVTFWSVWEGAELVGCGALKELDGRRGEIKSMRTARTHLRRGIGTVMLEHILDEACRRGYERVSLETGAQEEFEPARALYRRFGFVHCEPFGDYREDPNSVFMTRSLP